MEDKELVELFLTQQEGINKRLDDHFERVDNTIKHLPCIAHGEKIVALLVRDDERVKSITKKLTIFGMIIALLAGGMTRLISYFIEK